MIPGAGSSEISSQYQSHNGTARSIYQHRTTFYGRRFLAEVTADLPTAAGLRTEEWFQRDKSALAA